MVITKQGVAIQPGFSSKTTCSFENRPIGCVYKTGAKYASKDEIELAVLKDFREVLIEVLSFGFGSRYWSSHSCSWYCSSMGYLSFTP